MANVISLFSTNSEPPGPPLLDLYVGRCVTFDGAFPLSAFNALKALGESLGAKIIVHDLLREEDTSPIDDAA